MLRQVRLAGLVLFLSLCSTIAAIGDEVALKNPERRLVKEPAYENAPQYLLLALGPKAETCVWVVEDGRKLYVDRNANGDLTDDGSPVEPTNVREFNSSVDSAVKSWDFEYELAEFAPVGRDKQTSFKLRRWNFENAKQDSYGLSLTLDGRIPMYTGWFGSFWGAAPGEASIVHFGAPLTPSMLRYDDFALSSGLRRLSVGFFAPGMGDGSESRLDIEAVSADVVPVLEIEWPTANGGPPLRTTHRLDQRCCYWEFYTTEFEVPAEAAVGTAKVSLELPEGAMPLPLTTTTWEVPVVAADQSESQY